MSTTIKTLFDAYRESREFKKLADNSKKTYELMMKVAETDYFLIRNRVIQITEEFIDDLYEQIKKKKSVQHANMFMRVMRRIWSVGRRKKLTKGNPFTQMGLETVKPREVRWTKTDLDVYIAKTTELKLYDLRTLVSFCYVLGQRPGDMGNLTKTNFKNDLYEVSFVQTKTKKHMHLPVPNSIRRYAVAAFTTRDKLIESTQRELNTQHNEVLKLTGLSPDLQIRDLRRTALIETMEANATDAEGQSISGHVDRDMLNTYAPPSLQMAKNAMLKRFGNLD